MSIKSKINLNRVDMPKQPPEERRYNFQEVALGLEHHVFSMFLERISAGSTLPMSISPESTS